MRIIGGKFKGRVLKRPGTAAIRPTSDRLRETVFNILAHAYGRPFAGARIIDLYAGTGAMGVEALSRGGAFALFIDSGARACAIVRANAEALGLGGAFRILKRDARKLGKAGEDERFDLAFLDPPYGRDFVWPTLVALRDGGWLYEGALVVIEESARASIALPEGFSLHEKRKSGDTQILFAGFE
jgi:16S rRNA (guanine966-N2)-methyltransferase